MSTQLNWAAHVSTHTHTHTHTSHSLVVMQSTMQQVSSIPSNSLTPSHITLILVHNLTLAHNQQFTIIAQGHKHIVELVVGKAHPMASTPGTLLPEAEDRFRPGFCIQLAKQACLHCGKWSRDGQILRAIMGGQAEKRRAQSPGRANQAMVTTIGTVNLFQRLLKEVEECAKLSASEEEDWLC